MTNINYGYTERKGRHPQTGAEIYYVGKPLATKPTDARFPDGDYTIHVLASDLVHPNAQGHLAIFRSLAPFFEVPPQFTWEEAR